MTVSWIPWRFLQTNNFCLQRNTPIRPGIIRFGTRLTETLTGTHVGLKRLFTWDFTRTTSTGTFELRFQNCGYLPSDNNNCNLPWVPEAFHARFPVSFKCLRPAAEHVSRPAADKTKLPDDSEKKPLVPRVVATMLRIETYQPCYQSPSNHVVTNSPTQ